MPPGLLSVAEARALVLADAQPTPFENSALTECCGRVLAEDLKALRTQPPADLSAMDGYAVRAADIAAAPATLRLVGEAAAGHPFAGTVGAGEAARIFTGAVVPAGADTVVAQEDTSGDGARVTVAKAEPPGRYIRRAGADFAHGEVLLEKSRRLTERDLMLAAAMNHPTLPVHRRPRVAVLATGDELVHPGSEPGPGEIVYSNGYAIMALAACESAVVTDLGIAPDRLDATVAAVCRAREAQADILLTIGGASVGAHDMVQRALAAEGLSLSFWKVAMRPGRPLMHGRLGGMHVLGLPGNPVSAYVCALLFLVPLIRRLAGRTDLDLPMEPARLGCDMPANADRTDYLRAMLSRDSDGGLVAVPLPSQDSSLVASLARADCLIVRSPLEPAAAAGNPCSVVKLTRVFERSFDLFTSN